MFGIMAWVNGIALVFLFPKVVKVYNDYVEQRKKGVEEPYFNPQKLGIKNVDVWMDINKEQIERDERQEARTEAENPSFHPDNQPDL